MKNINDYNKDSEHDIDIDIVKDENNKYTGFVLMNHNAEPCSYSQFRVYSVGIGHDFEKSDHLNVLIVDDKRKTVELFEPHGHFGGYYIPWSRISQSDDDIRELNLEMPGHTHAAHVIIESAIRRVLKRVCGPDYTYIPQSEASCPIQANHQMTTEDMGSDGYLYSGGMSICSLHTTLYAFVRLNNPDVPISIINEKMTQWAGTDDAQLFPFYFMAHLLASFNDKDYEFALSLINKTVPH